MGKKWENTFFKFIFALIINKNYKNDILSVLDYENKEERELREILGT